MPRVLPPSLPNFCGPPCYGLWTPGGPPDPSLKTVAGKKLTSSGCGILKSRLTGVDTVVIVGGGKESNTSNISAAVA